MLQAENFMNIDISLIRYWLIPQHRVFCSRRLPSAPSSRGLIDRRSGVQGVRHCMPGGRPSGPPLPSGPPCGHAPFPRVALFPADVAISCAIFVIRSSSNSSSSPSWRLRSCTCSSSSSLPRRVGMRSVRSLRVSSLSSCFMTCRPGWHFLHTSTNKIAIEN